MARFIPGSYHKPTCIQHKAVVVHAMLCPAGTAAQVHHTVTPPGFTCNNITPFLSPINDDVVLFPRKLWPYQT